MAIPSGAGADDDFVVRDFLRIMREHIALIMLVALAATTLAFAYLKLAKPIFSTIAVVQIDVNNGVAPSSGEAANTIRLLPSNGSMKAETEIELFKSGAVLDPVIARFALGTLVLPHVIPLIGAVLDEFDVELSRGPFANGSDLLELERIDVPIALQDARLKLRALGKSSYALEDSNGATLLNGEVGQPVKANGISVLVSRMRAHPGATFDVVRYSQSTALQMLQSRLSIGERGKNTGVLQISVSGTNAGSITDEANAIVESYMRLRTTRAQEEAGRMLQFLRQQLPNLQDEVRRSESAVVDFQSSQGTFETGREAQTYLSGGLDLDRQIAMLQMQRQQLLQKFTPATREVKSVDAQIASLSALKERLEAQYKGLPDMQQRAATLQRDAKVNSEIYLSLLNRMQELSVSKASAVGGAHTVDAATIPTKPTSPKSGPVLAGGLLLGILAGTTAAYIRERYIRGFTRPEIIERESHLPVLAVIPLSDRQYGTSESSEHASAPRHRLGHFKSIAGRIKLSPETNATNERHSPVGAKAHIGASDSADQTMDLLALAYPFDDSIESLRGLRESLLLELADTDARSLVVTSPAPYDGKSFISANLAAVIAESGKRVLLIDADMRRGHLAEKLGLQSASGKLASQLLEPAGHDNLARPTCVPNLDLLNTSEPLRNPSAVLSKERFESVLAAYRREYDLIVIDTPPLLAVPDAAVIASVGGATLLVVRAGVHSAENISQSMIKLSRARAHVVGVVLNGTTRKLRRRNGTYDYAFAYSYK